MRFLFTIAFRNLVRQKRRNLLLGMAIAVGTTFLILAHSFAHGISDVLFNQIVVYVAGHVGIGFTKGGNVYNMVFHDGPRIREIADRIIPDIEQTDEAIGVFARAVGNGRSDNVIMVGMDMETEISDELAQEHLNNFQILEGSFDGLRDTSIEHPVVLAQQKAEYLNLKLHDVVKVRFTDLHGRHQAERLTVVAIFKPANIFMAAPIFLRTSDLKNLLGYGPYDIAKLQFRIKDPRKNARRYADSLHAALQPATAVISGRFSGPKGEGNGIVLGYRTDSTFVETVNNAVRLVDGGRIGERDFVVSWEIAKALAVGPGDTCSMVYRYKHTGENVGFSFPVTGVAEPEDLHGKVVLINDEDFYDQFYERWPQTPAREDIELLPDSNSVLFPAIGTEWILVERIESTQDLQKRQQEISQKGWEAIAVDVQSMYESASAVISLEYALGLITFIAVMILFLIILVGVVNTVRMTIRERTREIGTTRAIGMQRSDVRNIFLMETGFLALFASMVGGVAAFVGMWVLSLPKIDAGDNPMGMLLVNGHLHFSPTISGVIFYVLFIVFMAVVTAWFPARKAANLSAAEALRHFE